MRYGLELPCGGEGVTAAALVDLAVEAERSGWDGVFLEDYLVYYRGEDPPTFDPWVMLATVAAHTKRIWLGTTVSGLLARDPVKLAREASTLAALAPGRVVLGVGVGDAADRGTHLGFWPRSRGSAGAEVDRRLDLLLDLLRGRPVASLEDEPDVRFRPSANGVRVWVGGSAQAAAVMRRAASADGIVPYKLTDTTAWSDLTEDDVRALVAAVTRHRGSDTAGSDGAGFDVAVGGRRRLDDAAAEREAVEAAEAGGATWWLEFVHPDRFLLMLDSVGRGPLRAAP